MFMASCMQPANGNQDEPATSQGSIHQVGIKRSCNTSYMQDGEGLKQEKLILRNAVASDQPRLQPNMIRIDPVGKITSCRGNISQQQRLLLPHL